jgi:hypothetical protein
MRYSGYHLPLYEEILEQIFGHSLPEVQKSLMKLAASEEFWDLVSLEIESEDKDLMGEFVKLEEVIVVFVKDIVRMQRAALRLSGFENIDIDIRSSSEEAVYMAQFPKCPRFRVRVCKPIGKSD